MAHHVVSAVEVDETLHGVPQGEVQIHIEGDLQYGGVSMVLTEKAEWCATMAEIGVYQRCIEILMGMVLVDERMLEASV